MKTLEDMIKEKIEEVVLLMEANHDRTFGLGTAYELENGHEVTISVSIEDNGWKSSSYDC